MPQHWTNCITFRGASLTCVDRLTMNQLYYGDNLEVLRQHIKDESIDLVYLDEGKHGRTKQVILSVKSGHLKLSDLRDLRGVLQREAAQMGVLISLQTPTRPMRTEAASAGFYASPWGNYPTLQLLTIADIFDGKGIDYPGWVNVTYRAAPKARPREPKNFEIHLDPP